MSKRIQPQFQLLINDVDVTDSVKGEVSFTEEPDIITNLSFTLGGRQFAVGVADIIKLGDKVTFYGGTFGNSLIKPAEENYKLFFNGHVKNLAPQFAETGLVSVNIEAVDTGYVAFKEKINFTYPSRNAKTRTWANSKELTVEDIVRNIIEKELDLKVGTFEVPDAKNIKYTRKKPISQSGVNDWKFLRKLGRECGCDVYSRTSENGETEISFIDRGKQKAFDDKKVRFIYPLRENGVPKESPNQNPFVLTEINTDPNVADIPVLSLELTQDLTLFYANRRTVQVFDSTSGQNINVIQTYDELTPEQEQANKEAKAAGKPEPFKVSKVEGGKQFVINYYRMEIDESKLPADPVERDNLKKIALKVATQESKDSDGNKYSFEDIKKYFKRAEFLDPRFKVVDQPYIGIDVNVTIEGEVFLRNQRAYPIVGIQRYGSDVTDSSYHLRTITHRWGDEGYLCDLQFKL